MSLLCLSYNIMYIKAAGEYYITYFHLQISVLIRGIKATEIVWLINVFIWL